MNGLRKFQLGKFGSSGQRKFDDGSSKRLSVENKDHWKFFNCGDTDHFAKDYKTKENDFKNESYEAN